MKPKKGISCSTLFIIILATFVRLIFTYVNNRDLDLNPDENRNFQIATNHINGLGYTINNKLTAFHSTFPVFTYELLLKIGISKELWAFFIHFLSVAFFSLSIYYFFRLNKLFIKNEKKCLIATAIFAFYPSNIYYIGSLFNYEKIILPILILVVYKLVLILKGEKLKAKDTTVIILLVVISCLYRAQLIFIYFGLFTVYSILVFLNYKKLELKKNILFLTLLTVAMIIVHIPIVKKNHDMFGKYILSNQTGLELLLGHSPIARGSDYGNWRDPEGKFHQYVKKVIPDIDMLDECQSSQEMQHEAINWILNNPIDEIKLIIRKLAIYFLPRNYISGYNILNFIVHILFILSIVYSLFHLKEIKQTELLILCPIIFSILISIIFYVGYRWRFYAEPFMIAYSLISIQKILKQRIAKTLAPNKSQAKKI